MPNGREENLMTQTETKIADCVGQKLVSNDDEKIGEIKDLYVDGQTGRPEWFAVATGLFGTHVSFVPLGGASWTDHGIAVPYTKGQVKDETHIAQAGHLRREDTTALYLHSSLSYID